MSHENREEEPDEDFSNSSDTSSSTSCITATTNTSSTSRCSHSDSKSTSSGDSDNEGDNDNLQSHSHRQCEKSRTPILGNTLSFVESQSRRTSKPAPSPSPSLSTIDTNNNKGNNSSLKEGLSNIKRTNFSKSASGSRLINRSRPNVCDCLTQDCSEKKHSNRRQFIEQYYNSRTQLPTADTSTSSFNISTPLNRLSECDAITRRLLSSPITGRSLSVCGEETLNPRSRSTSANHSSNLNRAISLAYESGSSSAARRLLTIIPLFGCDIKSLEQFTKLGLVLPPVIDSAVDYLLVNGIDSIGIFRKSGVKSRILSLRQRIEANQNLKFAELNQNNEFSIYDIADLVKMWFRDLKPGPLMTKELIKLISSFLNRTSNNTIAGIFTHQDELVSTSQSTRIRGDVDPILRSKINSITTLTHRTVLLRALSFLAKISSRCEKNQMTSQNLAICLTPSLCETESDQNSILHDQKALEYCIDNHHLIFKD